MKAFGRVLMMSAVAILVFENTLGAMNGPDGSLIGLMMVCPSTSVIFEEVDDGIMGLAIPATIEEIVKVIPAQIKEKGLKPAIVTALKDGCTCAPEPGSSTAIKCKVGEACIYKGDSQGDPGAYVCVEAASQLPSQQLISAASAQAFVIQQCSVDFCACGVQPFSLEPMPDYTSHGYFQTALERCKKNQYCGAQKGFSACFDVISKLGTKCDKDGGCLYWCSDDTKAVNGECYGICGKDEVGIKGVNKVVCANKIIEQEAKCDVDGSNSCACRLLLSAPKAVPVVEEFALAMSGEKCSKHNNLPVAYKTLKTSPGFCLLTEYPCLCKLGSETSIIDKCGESEYCDYDRRDGDWTVAKNSLCGKLTLHSPLEQCMHADHCVLGLPYTAVSGEGAKTQNMVVPYQFFGVFNPLFGSDSLREKLANPNDPQKFTPRLGPRIPTKNYDPKLGDSAVYKTDLSPEWICDVDNPFCRCSAKGSAGITIDPFPIRLCLKGERCSLVDNQPVCESQKTRFGFCESTDPKNPCDCGEAEAKVPNKCPGATFCAKTTGVVHPETKKVMEDSTCYPNAQVIEQGAKCTNKDGCVCTRKKAEWKPDFKGASRSSHAICDPDSDCALDVEMNVMVCKANMPHKPVDTVGDTSPFLCHSAADKTDLIFCSKETTCIKKPEVIEKNAVKNLMFVGPIVCVKNTPMFHSEFLVSEKGHGKLAMCGQGTQMNYCTEGEQCVTEKPLSFKPYTGGNYPGKFEAWFLQTITRNMFWRLGEPLGAKAKCLLPDLGPNSICEAGKPCICYAKSPLQEGRFPNLIAEQNRLDASNIDALCAQKNFNIGSGKRVPIAVQCQKDQVCLGADGGPVCATVNAISIAETYYGTACAGRAKGPGNTLIGPVMSKSCHYGEKCAFDGKSNPSCQRINNSKLILRDGEKCTLFNQGSCVCSPVDSKKTQTCNPGHTCTVNGDTPSCGIPSNVNGGKEIWVCPANQYCYCGSTNWPWRMVSKKSEVLCVKNSSFMSRDTFETDKVKYKATISFDDQILERLVRQTYRFENSVALARFGVSGPTKTKSSRSLSDFLGAEDSHKSYDKI